MLRHGTRTILSALYLLHLLIFPFFPTVPAFANEDISQNPWSLLERHREQILQLSSDEDAFAFFHSVSPLQSKARQIRNTTRPSQNLIVPEEMPEKMKKAIPTYLASLAVIAYSRTYRKNMLEPALPKTPSSQLIPGHRQLQWITNQSPLQTFKSATDFFQQVSNWTQITSQPLPPDNGYTEFAAYYDHAYPYWEDHSLSWTSLFQKQGQQGVETRLREYWQASDQPGHQQSVSPSTQHAYVQRYTQTRLLPLFQAALLSHLNHLEVTGYETGWESWHQIQQWQQQNQIKSATARLCGTWKWLVHNHQNHGDHKATITFSPPDDPSSQIQPTTIQIQGDTVYLKWTFPQGIQEDSLLLSNHDTHLEGTFKNSLGPHGSISGKRLSTCRS